jgi:hypothetical protein
MHATDLLGRTWRTLSLCDAPLPAHAMPARLNPTPYAPASPVLVPRHECSPPLKSESYPNATPKTGAMRKAHPTNHTGGVRSM